MPFPLTKTAAASPATVSLLARSASARLLGALLASVALWLSVAWAISAN